MTKQQKKDRLWIAAQQLMDEKDLDNISVTVKTYHRPRGVATALHEFFIRKGAMIELDDELSHSIASSDVSVSQSGSEDDDAVSKNSNISVNRLDGEGNLSAHSKKMMKKRNSYMEENYEGSAI